MKKGRVNPGSFHKVLFPAQVRGNFLVLAQFFLKKTLTAKVSVNRAIYLVLLGIG